MIRDHLVPAVKEVFPNLAFKISPTSNPIIALSSSSAEIGDLHIYDDGDQATVIITGITHGDFGVYDENLNTEEKKQRVFPRLRTTQKIIFRSESPLNQVLHGFSERKMI